MDPHATFVLKNPYHPVVRANPQVRTSRRRTFRPGPRQKSQLAVRERDRRRGPSTERLPLTVVT
jgi:hypothetical protein